MPTPPRPDTIRAAPGRSNFRSGGALAAWVNSWLRGTVAYDVAVVAVQKAGIPTVRGLPARPQPAPVGWVLGAVRSAGATPLRLVLPVPGDTRGVPGVPGLSAAATSAGQLVLGPALAFMPDDDPAADGGWLALDVSGAPPVAATPGELQTVSQAAGALRLAVLEATDALAALDVSRWHAGVESLQRREQLVSLPPDHEPSAVALAARCSQLSAILDLANTDAPGGAIHAYGASARDGALRRLSVAVREALMCAYSWMPLSRTVDS